MTEKIPPGIDIASWVRRFEKEHEVEMRCKTCRFFSDPDKLGGLCFRYPPMIVQRAVESAYISDSRWPEVAATHWCGEWQAVKS
jgi:hypothetical protein